MQDTDSQCFELIIELWLFPCVQYVTIRAEMRYDAISLHWRSLTVGGTAVELCFSDSLVCLVLHISQPSPYPTPGKRTPISLSARVFFFFPLETCLPVWRRSVGYIRQCKNEVLYTHMCCSHRPNNVDKISLKAKGNRGIALLLLYGHSVAMVCVLEMDKCG